MSKQTDTPRVERHLVPSLLARKYMKDYEASAAEFPEDKRVEFLEHLLESLDIVEAYMSSPTKENWKVFADKENAFLKKHGKRLKIYRQKRMYLYYGDSIVLCEKAIYTTEEWNSLSREKQKLNPEEFSEFAKCCRNSLYLDREFLLLEQSPEDERKEGLNGTFEGKGNGKKRKIKRTANDNLTCLNQAQTALLIYYLQQERVFLKDELLKKTDAGAAFEILTGYSQETLRQELGKLKDHQNKINLKEIDNLLTRLKIAIDKALKEK